MWKSPSFEGDCHNQSADWFRNDNTGGDTVKVRNMARSALFAALLTVCAWIAVPLGDISFTLQTFAVALTLGLLGGKWGSLSIAVYLLLGAAGLPVFSGFRGGLGALLGVTGGYILGFALWGLVYWLITALWGTGAKLRLFATVLGLLLCYAFGTAWFCFGYLDGGSYMSIGLILTKCVLPFVLPDALKLSLAFFLTQRLKRFVP